MLFGNALLFLAPCFLYLTDAQAGDAADWNRFVVKDIKLGMPLKSLPGFKTCERPPGYSKYNVPYFKIIDKRCDKGTGNVCAIEDKASCGPTFNGESADNGRKTEVEYIQVIATTETDEPRVYKIDYYFPRQFLTETSPLGLALKAKYGDHCQDSAACYRSPETTTSDKIGGGAMAFKSTTSDVFLEAYCLPDNYSWGNTNQCRISVTDMSILEVDRKKQEAIDFKRNQANQAKPPVL